MAKSIRSGAERRAAASPKCFRFLCDPLYFVVWSWFGPFPEATVSDSVVVDAKRILLRYGAPIGLLDEIQEADRIAFARAVSRTPVPERGERLLGLLVEHGYLDEGVAEVSLKKLRKARKKAKK